MIKVCKDGFVWLVVDKTTAVAIMEAGTMELYQLDENETETLVKSRVQLESALKNGCTLVIEVGFVRETYLTCPMCGDTLVNLDTTEKYNWKCNGCGTCYYSNEL